MNRATCFPGFSALRSHATLALLGVGLICLAQANPSAGGAAHPLVWDSVDKVVEAKPGEETALFVFSVHNTAEQPVEIKEVRPSCGCTVAEVPASPWILPAGGRGSFQAVIDFRGKHGSLSRAIQVFSAPGQQSLGITVKIPDSPEAERLRNQQLALVDRQAIFRDDCASCHAAPTVGKTGEALFQTACGICHLSPRRAAMVPDLLTAREPRDEAYWRKWITEGREKTLMPAFAEAHGGPLSPAQIESLIVYALGHLPSAPPPRGE